MPGILDYRNYRQVTLPFVFSQFREIIIIIRPACNLVQKAVVIVGNNGLKNSEH